jgi:putative addiction module component (TIGR02574 family)
MQRKQSIIDEAMKFPEIDRLEIAEALFESIAGPRDIDAQQAWSEEIERRLAEVDAGRATFVPWEQARRAISGESTDEHEAD